MFRKKIYLLIIILILGSIPSLVKGEITTDKFSSKFINSFSFVDTVGHYGNFQHFTRVSDGTIAYCIEPGVSLGKNNYNGYYDLTLNEMASNVNLTSEQLTKVALYAYFGYGYNNHFGDDWIVATQALIWYVTGRTFQFTSMYNPTNPYDYVIDTPSLIKSHMDEIEGLVNSFLAKPEFVTKSTKIGLNSSFNYGKLNGYIVVRCSNCTYSIVDGNLVVTPNSMYGSVDLNKSLIHYYNSSFAVYEARDGQNMLVPGNFYSFMEKVSFEVVSGELRLKKYDYDNKRCEAKLGGSLKGSIYKLYKENGDFVSDLEIDDNCNASISNLEMGKYYVKEDKAGTNYEIDENTYYFEITLDKPIVDLTLYDKMFLGQILINKYDRDTKSCKSSSRYASLSQAEYGIYNKDGDLIEVLETDGECKALSKDSLLLGDYYIQEIKPSTGYKLDENKYYFSVTKDNADNLIILDVYEEIYKTKLVINKNYLYFNDIKPEEGAMFEIYYKSNMEYVGTLEILKDGTSSIVLPYGEYVIKQTKSKLGYKFQDDVYLTIDENTDYLTQLTFLNEPFLGTLEFYKIDGKTNLSLANVLIEIYNENDELVYQGVTDINGIIRVDGLPYGSYYILEKKALNGYKLYNDKLYFKIKEDKEVVRVEMENVRVPSTGKSNLNNKLVEAIIFIILGIGLILYGKEKH